MNVKWASDQTLILESQYICQNYGSVRNGKDLSTTDHVWDTNNINVCFQLFPNTNQNSYYKRNNFCFNFISCLNYASKIYIFVNLFIFLTYNIMILANIIATSIGCHVCGGLCDGVILIPVWVTICDNGATSF